ncbi:FxLYD domain-containing protein [Isoptericola sp. NPDC056578]|uniref:FxLYD domain-containing protein n=1 Tax=Isoptericola sp. NPDC056578 TaxID=3345870 RepID=UPI0036968572
MSQTLPPSQGIPVPPTPAPPAPQRGNAMAITGFVVAVVALVLCFVPIINTFAFFLALVGLVFGIIGLVRTRKGAARKGLAVAAIIVSVVAGAGVLISQAVYGAMADSVSESFDDVSADLDKMSGDATEQVLADEVSVEIGDFSADEDEYGLVTSALPVTLTNTSDETQSFDVTVEAVDESGNRISNDVAYVSELRAGQSDEVDLFQFVEEGDLDEMKGATFEVVEASAY